MQQNFPLMKILTYGKFLHNYIYLVVSNMAEYRDPQVLGRTEYWKCSDADAIGVIFTKPYTSLIMQQNLRLMKSCKCKMVHTGHRMDTGHPPHEPMSNWWLGLLSFFPHYLRMIIVQLHWSTVASFSYIMRRTQHICTAVIGQPELPSSIPLLIAATVFCIDNPVGVEKSKSKEWL